MILLSLAKDFNVPDAGSTETLLITASTTLCSWQSKQLNITIPERNTGVIESFTNGIKAHPKSI